MRGAALLRESPLLPGFKGIFPVKRLILTWDESPKRLEGVESVFLFLHPSHPT